MCDHALSDNLLEWYDSHARMMPWRINPSDRKRGILPDPYRVWLSEVMLQQTTVAAVKSYFLRFTSLWPSVHHLAAASDDEVMGEWAGLGYYARARNLIKCARVVSNDFDGVFPSSRDELLSLPGIGPYTASAIAAIALDKPETVVDGNVERVMSRLHEVQTPLPTAKADLSALAAQLTPSSRPGDYAQAVMDLGATICTPKNPACGLCPWRSPCKARRSGKAADLPRKLPKKPKPTRFGIAYVARRADGAWLLERRPDEGLLGGMLGWPGSDWNEDPEPKPPVKANWTVLTEEAHHTFTHFHLRLKIAIAETNAIPDSGVFLASNSFHPTKLPTVMRKVFDLAAPELAKYDGTPAASKD